MGASGLRHGHALPAHRLGYVHHLDLPGLCVNITPTHLLQLPLYPIHYTAVTTRALMPGAARQSCVSTKTPLAARGVGGLKRGGRVVRAPFLNQGLAKAAHTRLFSTTEEAPVAAASPAAGDATAEVR